MANLTALGLERSTYALGMTHGSNTDDCIPSPNIGPDPDLERHLAQLDGLFVGSKLLDKGQPPTSDQSQCIGLNDPSASSGYWSDARPVDELQEELEGIHQQTSGTTQEETGAQSMPVQANVFDAESTRRSWNMVQQFRTVMQDYWLRGRAVALGKDMHDIIELHSRHQSPGDFRDYALFNIRAVATQSVPLDLNMVFVLVSLVYAALKVLRSMELMFDLDVLNGINTCIDLLQDPTERRVFMEFAKRTYQECQQLKFTRRMSSQRHTNSTPQAQANLSQPSMASMSLMPFNDAYLSPSDSQHPDARSVNSDFGYPWLSSEFPSFHPSPLLAMSDPGTRPVFSPESSAGFGAAPSVSSSSWHDQTALERSDYGGDGSQLEGYPTTHMSSTGSVPQITHIDFNGFRSADSINPERNPFAAASKALKPFIAFLSYFDETLYRLSGNGITAKKLQSGLPYNDEDQEIAKGNIKGYFLSPSEPSTCDQPEIFRTIQSITIHFVDMGLLSTITETNDFMNCIGKVSIRFHLTQDFEHLLTELQGNDPSQAHARHFPQLGLGYAEAFVISSCLICDVYERPPENDLKSSRCGSRQRRSDSPTFPLHMLVSGMRSEF